MKLKFATLGAAVLAAAIPLPAVRVVLPVLSRLDTAFLRDQARRIVESASRASGQTRGRWRNPTPYTLHVPGGNMGYPASWVRDAVMIRVPSARVRDLS